MILSSRTEWIEERIGILIESDGQDEVTARQNAEWLWERMNEGIAN